MTKRRRAARRGMPRHAKSFTKALIAVTNPHAAALLTLAEEGHKLAKDLGF